MLGRFRVATRVMNLLIRKKNSQADYSATFGKLKNATPFLLPAAGMLASFFVNYSTNKVILQDSDALEILLDFLPSRIKGTIPYSPHHPELLKKKEYISRESIEA